MPRGIYDRTKAKRRGWRKAAAKKTGVTRKRLVESVADNDDRITKIISLSVRIATDIQELDELIGTG